MEKCSYHFASLSNEASDRAWKPWLSIFVDLNERLQLTGPNNQDMEPIFAVRLIHSLLRLCIQNGCVHLKGTIVRSPTF